MQMDSHTNENDINQINQVEICWQGEKKRKVNDFREIPIDNDFNLTNFYCVYDA